MNSRPICTDDFGNEVYRCRATGTLHFHPDDCMMMQSS